MAVRAAPQKALAAISQPGPTAIAWLRTRHNAIIVLALTYIGLCLVPLAIGMPLFSGFALLPMILAPALGWICYWLVWKEFHD